MLICYYSKTFSFYTYFLFFSLIIFLFILFISINTFLFLFLHFFNIISFIHFHFFISSSPTAASPDVVSSVLCRAVLAAVLSAHRHSQRGADTADALEDALAACVCTDGGVQQKLLLLVVRKI